MFTLERLRSDFFRQQTVIHFDIKLNLTALKNSNRSHSFEQFQLNKKDEFGEIFGKYVRSYLY